MRTRWFPIPSTPFGCPTLWRNDTLARMADRFDDVFPAVLPYCSDEHEWAYLTGRLDPVDDPVGLANAEGVGDHREERLGGFVDSRLTVDPNHLDDVVGRLHASGIHTLTVTPPSLDALFLRNYDETPTSRGEDLAQVTR